MHRSLIVAPMTSELRPLVKYTRARRSILEGLSAYTARVAQTEVVLVQIGMGPSSAQRATALALAQIQVDHVLVSGIAGGLHPDLVVGTVVVPEVVLDVSTGRRFHASPIRGVERNGVIASADHLVIDEEELADLQRQGVMAVEMESSGVAAACEEAGTPWTTFRAIGDRPDEGLTDDTVMSLLRPDGTSDVPAALRLMLLHPTRIPAMVRLARDSSGAASKAARTALRALGWRA